MKKTHLIIMVLLGIFFGTSEGMLKVVVASSPEAVIEVDVTAQNNHDWSAFLSIRTTKAGPPENRNDLTVLREKYPENDLMQNIVTARLVGIKALSLSLVEGLTKLDKYIELFGEAITWGLSIN